MCALQKEQRRLLVFGALFLPLHPCTYFLDKRKKKKVPPFPENVLLLSYFPVYDINSSRVLGFIWIAF
jgi:hypothetical protein